MHSLYDNQGGTAQPDDASSHLRKLHPMHTIFHSHGAHPPMLGLCLPCCHKVRTLPCWACACLAVTRVCMSHNAYVHWWSQDFWPAPGDGGALRNVLNCDISHEGSPPQESIGHSAWTQVCTCSTENRASPHALKFPWLSTASMVLVKSVHHLQWRLPMPRPLLTCSALDTDAH